MASGLIKMVPIEEFFHLNIRKKLSTANHKKMWMKQENDKIDN